MAEATANNIHVAISRGFFQQVRFHIDQGCDVNQRDKDGKTPLILCSLINDEKWSIGLARLFIENGARISKCDRDGYNALHHACINQKDKLVDVYLTALDCDVHSKCKKGNTSLHYAALLGNQIIIKALASILLKYKMSLDPINKKGLTPAHQAFRANHIDCGDLLLDYGADVLVVDPENKTCHDLRREALERLDLIETLKKSRKSSRTIKKIKEDANQDKPRPSTASIAVARPFDQRNNPEYVFHTSAVDYFQRKTAKMIMKRPHTAHDKSFSKTEIWKEELLGLWTHYETQCSNAFRMPAQPVITSDTPDKSKPRSDSVFSNSACPPLTRRNSRMGSKSRQGSLTSNYDNSPRRPSNASRRNGMPPLLVRTQSRASFTAS